MNILVVDDEVAIRLLCRVNLQADGFSVREAGDGASARASIREQVPDIVLLDVMLPGEDGFEIAASLRAEPATAEIPIIFLTARADIEDRERERSVGAIGYITKPFNPLELGRQVREAIAGRE